MGYEKDAQNDQEKAVIEKKIKDHASDRDLINYFLALKQTYSEQRQPLEAKWDQARDAVLVNDKLDKVYNGRSNFKSPIMKWKKNGIVARLMKIIFNVEPFARIEKKKSSPIQKNIVDLWNKYIFENQLIEINFKQNFKIFQDIKTTLGTAVAKITQEYEVKEFSMFEDEDPEEIVVKDNTYFRPLLLEEFYTDINKPNLQESLCNIHSTTISFEELRSKKKREIVEVNELIDKETGEVLGIEEKRKEIGMYENLELLEYSGVKSQLTEEQERYIQILGLNVSQQKAYQRELEITYKTGTVRIDECYGLFDLDGDGIQEEIICTIANGSVIIRKEPTPFKHRKYVRPFIRGVYEEVQNCFYGISNVIIGQTLLMELNASRAQAIDAKTASIFPMWYMNEANGKVIWDKVWRPNGIIKGNGPNAMTPIINPNLGNIAINDSQLSERDLDQLWSLSPVQQGTSDNRLIPKTASGTLQVISQNDMVLNDIIDTTVENELKPFLEMLFERNIQFKEPKDLLSVWDEKDLMQAGIEIDEQGNPINIDMKKMYFSPNIKVLGTLELSNEVAHQQGWLQFGQIVQNIPPLAGRIDWVVYGDKLLRSFGIKDDAQGIYIDEAQYQKAQADLRAAQEQEKQQAIQLAQFEDQRKINEHAQKTTINTEADIVKMQNEVLLEKATGEKVA